MTFTPARCWAPTRRLALAALAALALAGALAATASPDVRVLAVRGSFTYPAAGTFAFTATALLTTSVVPPNPVLPPNPIRVTVALGALGTNPDTNTQCAAAGFTTVTRSAGSILLHMANQVLSNPFTPIDSCRQLVSVPVAYRLTVNPDATITDAGAQVGTGSVDLPATLG